MHGMNPYHTSPEMQKHIKRMHGKNLHGEYYAHRSDVNQHFMGDWYEFWRPSTWKKTYAPALSVAAPIASTAMAFFPPALPFVPLVIAGGTAMGAVASTNLVSDASGPFDPKPGSPTNEAPMPSPYGGPDGSPNSQQSASQSKFPWLPMAIGAVGIYLLAQG